MAETSILEVEKTREPCSQLEWGDQHTSAKFEDFCSLCAFFGVAKKSRTMTLPLANRKVPCTAQGTYVVLVLVCDLYGNSDPKESCS